MPYFLACRYSRAWSRDYFSLSTSSREAFECETYCMKYLLSSSCQSRGGIILFSTSTLEGNYPRGWASGLGFSGYFSPCCTPRCSPWSRFPTRSGSAKKEHLGIKAVITILIFHRHLSKYLYKLYNMTSNWFILIFIISLRCSSGLWPWIVGRAAQACLIINLPSFIIFEWGLKWLFLLF